MNDPYVVIAPNEVLQGKKTVNINDIYDFPYITYNDSILSNYLKDHKFKEIIHFDSIDETSVITMVEKNIGIAILPSLMLKSKSKKTHTIKLSPNLSRTIYFAYNKDNISNSNHVKNFVKFIKSEFQKQNI